MLGTRLIPAADITGNPFLPGTGPQPDFDDPGIDSGGREPAKTLMSKFQIHQVQANPFRGPNLAVTSTASPDFTSFGRGVRKASVSTITARATSYQ